VNTLITAISKQALVRIGTTNAERKAWLGLEHHAYDALSGNLMDGFVQYVKDRTEGFDDYFPCRRERCRLEHLEGRETVTAIPRALMLVVVLAVIPISRLEQLNA
jgi:hypothetical protein